VSPRTYKMSGDIVRIKAARLPGKPVKSVENTTRTPDDASKVAQSY
jgi:hypothetical protein